MKTKKSALDLLSQDTGDFWVDFSIPVLEAKPGESIEHLFFREAFSRYHPCIIRGLVDHWPALSKWTPEYLEDKIKGEIEINITPDGRGDSVQVVSHPKTGKLDEHFVYPAEVNMTMKQFFSVLKDNENSSNDNDPIHENYKENIVVYLSQQNDNLRTNMPELLSDIDETLPLANSVFDCAEPEAVNLWIGDEKSVSSLHKDFYENLYAVVEGEKHFILYPPTDIVFFPEKKFKTLRYTLNNENEEGPTHLSPSLEGKELKDYLRNNIKLVSESSKKLNWVSFDPSDILSKNRAPSTNLAHPLEVLVSKGEVLYLPSLWYHQVTQTRLTIAVNYWYDMKFNFRYVFFKMAENIKKLNLEVNTKNNKLEKLKKQSLVDKIMAENDLEEFENDESDEEEDEEEESEEEESEEEVNEKN